MKFSLLCLLCAVSLAPVLADDTAPTTGSTPPSDAQGDRFAKFKAAMEKLDLTDAQKAQIKQIHATVTDKQERRKQIMAVLTPDQKQKLMQMIMEHRDAAQSGTTPAGT